jgi:hypothetical protein
MTNEQRHKVAKEYVDKQLATMRQAGSAPSDLSNDQYNKLITRVANTIQIRTESTARSNPKRDR